MRPHTIAFMLLVAAIAPAPLLSAPLVHTYSVVACDDKEGTMGVAVQSHWFAVGSRTIWAEPGRGVVATQAMTNPNYGRRGLARLGRGQHPRHVLRQLLRRDRGAESRQVAILDRRGRVAAHTGSDCIPESGHIVGPCWSVQANLMQSNTVVPAMAAAMRKTKGSLAERLLATLEAAEAAGGDARGCQAAAVLVVSTKSTGDLWEDVHVDVRVDDHRQPLVELRRLVVLTRAYRLRSKSSAALQAGNLDESRRLFGAATALAPHNDEFLFWHALDLANHDHLRLALPLFRRLFTRAPQWRTVIERLPGTSGLPRTTAAGRRLVKDILDGCRH